MNYTSFVELDDALSFNPGCITRVQFGYEWTAICRVTVSFVDGVSVTLVDGQLTSFLDWWNHRATVMTRGSTMTYYLNEENDGDTPDESVAGVVASPDENIPF